MVRIRLRRVGSRHQPSYRLIVADEESPRDGRFLENLGHHNPRTFPATTVVDEGRGGFWVGGGAAPPPPPAEGEGGRRPARGGGRPNPRPRLERRGLREPGRDEGHDRVRGEI